MTLDGILDKLRQWKRPWVDGTEPLEIHRAILEDVEAQVVSVGGGRRVFPFDRVDVKLLAVSPADRARWEAIAEAGWDLGKEIAERLAAQGVRPPEALAVQVEVTEEPAPELGERRYALQFRRAGSAPGSGDSGNAADELAAPPGSPARTGQPQPSARPSLRLTVLRGKAAQDAFDLAAERVYLGRLEEVLDAAGRVKRRNDVAFLEEDDANRTVSREHARIAWDPETRAFWLRDEGSAAGTLILRSGRSIEVSRHDRRGVRLESGDEVYLGRAAVRVELAPG